MPCNARSHTENAPRDCGGCTVCCTAMYVAPLNKPAGTPCTHCGPTGCNIYDHRPDPCRAWFCMWVRDAGKVFSDDERPDRLGVFFTASTADPQTGRQTIYAHEVRPEAVHSDHARRLIFRLARVAPVQIIGFRPPKPVPAPLTHNGDQLAA